MPDPVCCWCLQTAGVTLPAGIQALHVRGALEPQTKRSIPVPARAARFGAAGDMNHPDLEHAECWDQHRSRLKYGVKWLKLASHKQLQKTFPVWAIKAPAQKYFRWLRGTAALWERDMLLGSSWE